MEEIYFIDREGNKVSLDGAVIHEQIAIKVVTSNPNLNRMFQESGERNSSVFLMMYGYLHMSENKDEKQLTMLYSSVSLSEKTRKVKEYYEKTRNEYQIREGDIAQGQLEPEDIEKAEKLINERGIDGSMTEIIRMLPWHKEKNKGLYGKEYYEELRF